MLSSWAEITMALSFVRSVIDGATCKPLRDIELVDSIINGRCQYVRQALLQLHLFIIIFNIATIGIVISYPIRVLQIKIRKWSS